MTQWNDVSKVGLPDVAKRVIVARTVPNGNRYVDVCVLVPEEKSGLPPLCNPIGITHWAELPEPPEDDET